MSMTQQQAAAPVKSPAGAVRRLDVTLQIGSDSQTVEASKAELSTLSSVLREAFVDEPSCKTLKVDGPVEAWRFAASYLACSSGKRLAAFPHNATGGQILSQVLSIAEQYDMPSMMEEAVDAASRWGHLSFSGPVGFTLSPNCNTADHPAWWIDLANQYERQELATPAISLLLRAAATSKGNGSACAVALRNHGRAKQGRVWQSIMWLLEGL